MEKGIMMSLENVKKLEDLKSEANAILTPRMDLLSSQRPIAIASAIKEMGDYLTSQNFQITYNQGPKRGFVAKYEQIELKVTASTDDERFFGCDYSIDIESGKRKLQVRLNLNHGTRINPPIGGTLDNQINDYEKRYLPSLKALDNADLDGSYFLYIPIQTKNSNQIEKFADGKSVIDKFFE
jgi:hypothetical protein